MQHERYLIWATMRPPLPPAGFAVFQRDRIDALLRIARATPDRLKLDELVSDAWILACDLGARRGGRLDLASADAQELLLGALYNLKVKFVRGRRLEDSLDAIVNSSGNDTGTWHERLRAQNSEPLDQLLALEEMERAEGVPSAAGFSEFAAYIALLARFSNHGKELAAYLAISLRVLRQRIERARDLAGVQATLFAFETTDGYFVTRANWFKRLWSAWRKPKDSGQCAA